MFKQLSFAVIAAAFTLVASPAQARPLGDNGVTWADIVSIARGAGYQIEAVPPDGGQESYRINRDGVNSDIYLMECDSRQRCTGFQIYGCFGTPSPTPLTVINDWNERWRYGHAYLNSQHGGACVQMDLDMRGGSTEQIANTITMFVTDIAPRFAVHVGYAAAPAGAPARK